MANQDYIAIYPVSPCLQIGDEKINMFENLAKFKDQLVQSLQGVLNGEKRAVLVRIAHVGLKTDEKQLINDEQILRVVNVCENIYQANQTCYFAPIIGDEKDRERFKVGYFVNSERSTQSPILTYEYGFHADPLIFARRPNGELVESVTYGEDDPEPRCLWLRDPSDHCGNFAPKNKTDAYVFFNSTFVMRDYGIDFQVIHGGFKAEGWKDISEFRENIDRNKYRDRIEVNPHWVRGDDEGILMIVGDVGTWFFSMPIAPPPFYFIAQGDRKVKQSTKIINELLQQDIKEQLTTLKNKLRMKDNEVVKEALAFVKMYKQGKIEDDNSLLAQSLYTQRVVAAARLLEEDSFTPQIKFNHSYLDLYLTKPKDGQLKPSWYIAILLLLLIDNYINKVGSTFQKICDGA